MPDTTNAQNQASGGSGAPLGVRVGRRNLLRGAIGAAPVMLTLVSRPVIGASCTSASAFGSINASRPGPVPSCSGRSPGYWKNNASWPAGYIAAGSKATQFDDIFGTAGGYPGKSLLDVLGQGGGGKTALARQIVGALLNAAAQGLIPPTVFSVGTVKTIWTSFVTNGYYSPTAGVKWNSGDIVTWLKTTTA